MSKFSKKHYEAIAKVLKETDCQECGEPSLGVMEAIARMFKGDNERFDKRKFYKKCSLEKIEEGGD